jgi:hypothetical protein
MSIENNSTIEQSRNTPKGDAQSIPKGWVETTLGEVVKIYSGKAIWLSFVSLSACGSLSFINTAFRFSKLDKQTSWLTLA